jgi:hypothetical protein
MIDLDARPDELPEIEREPLFKLDGTLYSIPVEFRANQTLKFMHLLGIRGYSVAVQWAMQEAIGEKGYLALVECTKLTKADTAEIGSTIINKLIGNIEDPKGMSTDE